MHNKIRAEQEPTGYVLNENTKYIATEYELVENDVVYIFRSNFKSKIA